MIQKLEYLPKMKKILVEVSRKRKKIKYYVHPIDALDPGLDKNEIKNRKFNERTIGSYMLFLIIICFLIPVFDIISEMIRCGSILLKC